jgi:glycosyltransferase involved in cell wall biosynthesis
MIAKPRVLVLSGCYLPGFRGGGPMRSLVNLVKALSEEFDFRIITLDRDQAGDAPYAGVQIGSWQQVERATVLYLPRADITVSRLAQEVTAVAPQLVYLNGFFDPVFTLRFLLARKLRRMPAMPVLLAPLGDLSAGALEIKRGKKALYLRMARISGLYNGLTWQASTVMERDDIRRTLPHVRAEDVRVAADLTDDGEGVLPVREDRPAGAPLRVCFLSRISPKKNLDFALRVLAGVNVPVDFTIFGPIDDAAFWDACQPLIAQLPANVRASYAGEVHPADVRRTLATQDLFFLPTRGENFGHVIYEALSTGVPVLISDQTPWNDLEARGVGWNVPLGAVSDFVRAIETASRAVPAERQVQARRAIAYAMERADRSASIRRTSDLLRGVISQ